MASSISLSPLIYLYLAVAAGTLYFLHRLALPRPIPGIPYHKKSARRILGDVPDMLAHQRETGEIFDWMTEQLHELDSPIVQLFIRPFGRPRVVLCDFMESQDILMRRLKDFDRSEFFREIFVGVVPYMHLHMPSGERVKKSKRFLSDTMTPSFLNEGAAPLMYNAVSSLIDLWRVKTEIGHGRPFEAAHDIDRQALEIIFAVTFGDHMDATLAQTSHLKSLGNTLDLPENTDAKVVFPVVPEREDYDALLYIISTIATVISSPLPILHHWLIRQGPRYRWALKRKDQLVDRKIAEAIAKVTNPNPQPKSDKMQSAIDRMYEKEYAAAQKESREPDFTSPYVRDELFGFLAAGTETTSTTLTWGLKLFADHPSIQDKLRDALRTALGPDPPSAHAIATTHIHYFEATIEEILRVAKTAPGVTRKTLRDTTVLGKVIPAGTDIFIMGNGPSFFQPPLPINGGLRSAGAQSKGQEKGRGGWNTADIAEFNPERWLVDDETVPGGRRFDAMAGPSQPFGFGPRACFGKRLAYMELRMVLSLVVWNFRLCRCPEELSSYRAVDLITHTPQQCYVRLEPM